MLLCLYYTQNNLNYKGSKDYSWYDNCVIAKKVCNLFRFTFVQWERFKKKECCLDKEEEEAVEEIIQL